MQLTLSNNKRLTQTNFLNEIINRIGKKINATEGEVLRIKIIDYLGDGKLVVDLKGQRIVADSSLIIEAGQEIDVIVKSTDNNRVVLQVLSEDQNRGELRTEPDGLSKQIELLKQYNNTQNIYFELPLNFDDQKINSLVGFNFQPDKQISNILIAVELKNLGYMEFLINIVGFDLNCQIVSENMNTYKLAQRHISELKECLSKLGYKVENISCSSKRSTNIPYFIYHLDTSV